MFTLFDTKIKACNLISPLCNIQMLIEDYSNAIYWRIAAIFSTIAALFSVLVVLWYLIFRENPDMPDQTDSKEKIRFINDPHKENFNLMSELVSNFGNFYAKYLRLKIRKRETCGKSQSFLQRLAYFIFGSYGPGQNKTDDLEKLDISDDDDDNISEGKIVYVRIKK
jgi:hypothetical protein